MKKLSAKLSALAITLFPVLALAQGNIQIDATNNNFTQLLAAVGNLASRAIGILVVIALAVFFWGLVKYLFKLGGEEGSKNGKDLMIYGIVALFVMVSIWGIINFIANFFGLNNQNVLGQNTTSLVPVVYTGTIRNQ